MSRFAVLAFCLFLLGCKEDRNMYDAGYNDGYAVGYNTACKIRTTLIEGAWDDEEYTRGYNVGYKSGEAQCFNNQKEDY